MRHLVRFAATALMLGALLPSGPVAAEPGGPARTAATLTLVRTAAAPPRRWGGFSPLSHPQFDVYLPTGGLFHDRKLMEIPGGEYPFDLVLNHLAGIDHDGPFGRGVWSTLSGHLVPDASGAVTWFDERAAEVKFTAGGAGFVTPDGSFARLEAVLKGKKVKGYRLVSPGRWARLFDSAGRWTGLERPDRRVIKLKRLADQRISGLTTPEKRSIKFKYGKDRRLCLIEDWIKRLHTFGYDGEGRLVRIGRPLRDGDDAPVEWKLEYDAAGRIAKLLNGAGASLGAVEYDLTGRVAAIRGPGGDTTFDYDTGVANTVDATGRDGFLRSLELDAGGRIVRQSTRLTGGGIETETFEYDVHSRRTSHGLASGEVRRWTYLDTADPRDRENVTQYEQRPSDFPSRSPKLTMYTWLAGTDQALSATEPDGGRTDWTYDAIGQLTSLTLPDVLTEAGGVRPVTRYEYDALGRVAAITRPGGSREVRVWGKGKVPSDFLVSRTLDAGTGDDPFTGAPRINQTTSYEYDAAGNVVRITRPGGGVVRSEFDAWDRMTSYSDELGRTTTFVYDAEGNCIRTEAPFVDSAGDPVSSDVVATVGFFDPFRNLVRMRRDSGFGAAQTETFDFASGTFEPSTYVDPRGFRTVHVHDAGGRLLSTTRAPGSPDESVERFEYDARGRVTRHEDPIGRVTRFEYDGFGCLSNVTDPAGHVTRSTHDAMGRPVSRTILTNGTVEASRERYVYDLAGNLVTVERDRFTNPAGPNVVETTQTRFDARGFLVYEKDARGCTTRHTVDALGRVVRSLEVELDRAMAYEYDARGNIVRRHEIRGASGASPVTQTQRFEFDAAGRLVAMTDAAGDRSTFELDSLGQVEKATSSDGAEVRYRYDGNGRLVSESRTRGGQTISSSYQYDPNGNLITSMEADGRRFDFEYDALNRATRAFVNNDTEVERFEYDAAGQVTRRTGLGGNAMDFTYDPRGFLLSRTATTGESQTFTVSSIGTITGATDTRGGVTQTNTIAYDSTGSMVSDSQNGVGPSVAYGGGGLMTGMTTPNGMQYGLTYDAACRVATVTRDAAPYVTYEYVPGTELASRRAHPRMTSDYEYDEFDRRVRAAHANTEGIDSEWTAAYGANGRLTSHSRDDGTSEVLSYDEFGRLTRSDRTGAAGAGPRRTDVAYADGLDRASSLTLTPTSPAKSGGPKDFPGGNVTYTPLGFVGGVGNDTFSYDSSGHATNLFENRPAYPAGERKVKLDAFGRVIEVRKADDTLIASYRYDAFNRPVIAQEEEFNGAQLLTRQRAFLGCLLLWEFAPGALPGFDLFYVPNFAGAGHMASGFDDSFFAEHLWQDDCYGEPRQTFNLNNGRLQERYDRRDAWGQVHFETTNMAGVTSPFRGAPSLQSAANVPGFASSYATGLMFSWGLPPQDPFLPRPLTPEPAPPGTEDPPPRPQPYRPEPGGFGIMLNPLPRPAGNLIACNASLAKVCKAVGQLSRTADRAARCNDRLQTALDRIAQETEAIRRYQEAAGEALQALADQQWFLEALKSLDAGLQVAQLGASIRSIVGKAQTKIAGIAKAFKDVRTRVGRAIMGSKIAQEQAAAVGELVGEAVTQGVEAVGSAAGGKRSGDEFYGGEGFSLPGRLGLALGQLLSGHTFEGDAAALQAQIFAAQAGEALARSQIRQQKEALETVYRNKKIIEADAKAACANYDNALEAVAAWPSPELDEKKADADLLKWELSARGVR